MSAGKRYPFEDALKVAIELHDELKKCSLEKHCVIVGSLRRRKPSVGDIELLYVPKMAKVQTGLFDDMTVEVNMADRLFKDWLTLEFLAKRKNVSGHECWGPNNRYAIHVASGIPVDLFSTTIENWWVSLVIRTGPKHLNLQLTNGAHRQGATLHAYGAGITNATGEVVPATSEEDVFALCGVPYLEAIKR